VPDTSPGPFRRILLIHNPTAGRRKARRVAAVVEALRGLGCRVELKATEARGDAEAFARAAGPQDIDVVAVAGGDGTIAEVANGLAASGSNLPIAVLPMGTANVFAIEIGMPFAPAEVARVIAQGAPHPVHCGQANGRLFVQMVGVGFDAHVVAAVDLGLKRHLGKLAYAWAMLTGVLRFSAPLYRLSIDGVPHEARSVIVAKGRYYAGRFVIAPEARLDDPRFQVCLFARGSAFAICGYFLALALGRLHRHPDVRLVPGREIVIDGPAGEPIQADGDPAGVLPLRAEIAAMTLAVIAP
jgi:diacylglycerol kinase (ATP)